MTCRETAVALLGVVALVACAGGADRDAGGDGIRPAPTRTTVPSASTTPSPTPGTEPVPVPSDLAALLVDDAPPGFTADRIPEGMVGPIDASSLRDALPAQTARAWVQAGFRRGYGRAWRRPLGGAGAADVRSAWVLEFSDAAGAAAASAHTDDGPGVRDRVPLRVDDPPGAIGRRWTADDFTGPVRVDEVAFTRGRRLYVVRVWAPVPGPAEDAVAELAAAQARVAR